MKNFDNKLQKNPHYWFPQAALGGSPYWESSRKQCPTGRIFQNRVGYWKQILGSGSGHVGVLKYTIADCVYIFQLSYPIIGYLFFSQVFSGIPQFLEKLLSDVYIDRGCFFFNWASPEFGR